MAQAKKVRWVIGSAGVAGAMALGVPMMAEAADLFVKASVNGSCSVTGATLDFGSYTGARNDVSVPFNFSCSGPTNLSISMDGGTVGDPNGRLMDNEDFTSQISYQLFRDAGRTQIWGVFPQNSQDFTLQKDGAPVVFGRIESGQSPLPGNYSDKVLITLTTN